MYVEILSFTALAVSIIAFVFSFKSWQRAELPRLRHLEKLVGDIAADNLNLTDLHARMFKALQKVRNRLNSDDGRKTRKDIDTGLPDPEVDPEGWKAEIMRRNPQGAFTPPFRRE